ncbi:MAG: histidinol-phosphate transaminase [Arenicella sp.]|nr:histidinol-phosphate transaminase [Arenicella sp.]
MSRYWTESVHSLVPYVPGEQPQMDDMVKLNTNENPYEPSPKVLAAIHAAANEGLRKYPDPKGQLLKQTVASFHGLQPGQVFLGNSSDEVLAHTFRALLKHDRPLLFPDITYSFYPVWCRLFDIDYRTVPLRGDFSIAIADFKQDNGGIIFANPNAPTGMALRTADIEELLQLHANSVLVVDEAYADFSDQSAIKLIDKYPNLLVVQTLSKSHSLAGLRVGFAFGDTDLIAGLERVKNSFHPYALDNLALAGAIAAYEDIEYYAETRNRVITTREASIKNLQDLNFDVLPSAANFLLCKHKDVPAVELFAALRTYNIIVRHFDAPRINDYIRISIGTDQQMQRLFDALTEIIAR